MKFKVVYTDHFEREIKRLAKKYTSIKVDLESLLTDLELNPFQGKPLGKDCYKIRMAISSKGQGKSSGARVIIHVVVAGNTVYLLSIYDKSNQEVITDKEIMDLLKYIRE